MCALWPWGQGRTRRTMGRLHVRNRHARGEEKHPHGGAACAPYGHEAQGTHTAPWGGGMGRVARVPVHQIKLAIKSPYLKNNGFLSTTLLHLGMSAVYYETAAARGQYIGYLDVDSNSSSCGSVGPSIEPMPVFISITQYIIEKNESTEWASTPLLRLLSLSNVRRTYFWYEELLYASNHTFSEQGRAGNLVMYILDIELPLGLFCSLTRRRPAGESLMPYRLSHCKYGQTKPFEMNARAAGEQNPKVDLFDVTVAAHGAESPLSVRQSLAGYERPVSYPTAVNDHVFVIHMTWDEDKNLKIDFKALCPLALCLVHGARRHERPVSPT
ncbi:hypothetical protein QBC44DRAFT_307042 [Cladorrhinum sp. PSN332]|nr:hypothetical protein QBC44DRAFT_307042 [Cladorrhinum sp. PSN332]